jgi:hypothetical protein
MSSAESKERPKSSLSRLNNAKKMESLELNLPTPPLRKKKRKRPLMPIPPRLKIPPVTMSKPLRSGD